MDNLTRDVEPLAIINLSSLNGSSRFFFFFVLIRRSSCREAPSRQVVALGTVITTLLCATFKTATRAMKITL
ncbi:MAG: hypothetical protein ACK40M_15085, partial [Flavobacteriales bacterium]